MTEQAIWVLGDLRTERLWNESLMVMAKAMEEDPGTFLSREEQATFRDHYGRSLF